MTVRVRSLQGGKPLQVNFSDNFDRANENSLGENWLRYLGGNDTVTLESWGIADVLNNQCRIRGAGENNPNATLKTGWIPVPILNSRVFNAPRYFIECDWISFAGTISASLCLRYNQSREAGPGTQDNGMDGYYILFATAGGRIDKITNGSAQVTIGANVDAMASGETLRAEVENVGTSTIITSYVAGVQTNQVTELAAAFPIQRGWPAFVLTSVGGAPPGNSNVIWDNFRCGVF